MRDAGTGAQTLIGESAAQAKQDARSLVGEAMAECERLLRAAGEMSGRSQPDPQPAWPRPSRMWSAI